MNSNFTVSEIEKRVVRVIAEQMGMPERAVKLTESFVADMGADSLDLVEICMAMEDEFNIEVSDHSAETMKTGKDVVDALTKVFVYKVPVAGVQLGDTSIMLLEEPRASSSGAIKKKHVLQDALRIATNAANVPEGLVNFLELLNAKHYDRDALQVELKKAIEGINK